MKRNGGGGHIIVRSSDGFYSGYPVLEENPYDQTMTAAFKKWFGGSKVVDPYGKPLVVYHGTRREFSAFRDYTHGPVSLAFFTDDPKAAGVYSRAFGRKYQEGSNIMPVYLSLQNPKEIDFSDREDDRDVRGEAYLAADEGYDGLIVTNAYDGRRYATQYVTFRQTQIKSATGNRGTFDPHDSDIKHNPWSEKYKASIDCEHPKGFSQRAHCAGRLKRARLKLNPPSAGYDLLGRGSYAFAYSDHSQKVELILKPIDIETYDEWDQEHTIWYTDLSKEVMIDVRKLAPESLKKFLPEITRKRIDKSKIGEIEFIYEMPLYNRLPPTLDADPILLKERGVVVPNSEELKLLTEIIDKSIGELYSELPYDDYQVYEGSDRLARIDGRSLAELAVSNYSVDKNNNLIIRDPIVCLAEREDAEKILKQKFGGTVNRNPPSEGFTGIGEGSAAAAYRNQNLVEIITLPKKGNYDVSRDIIIEARARLPESLKKFLPIIHRKRIDKSRNRVEFIYEMPFFNAVTEGPDAPRARTDYAALGYVYPTPTETAQIESVINSVMREAYLKAGVPYNRELAKFDAAYTDLDSLDFVPKYNLGWYSDRGRKILVFRDPVFAWMPLAAAMEVFGSKFPENRAGIATAQKSGARELTIARYLSASFGIRK